MQSVQIFQYNNTSIEFEVINGEVFANATLMCQAFNKTPYEFLRSSSANRYIEALRKISEVTFVEIRNGGSNPCTWIHEKLIIKIASWLDVHFEIWCHDRIAELLRNGRVEIKPVSIEDVLIQQLQITKSIRLEQEQMKLKQSEQDERILQIEAKTTTRPDYFTVVGYATMNKIQVGLTLATNIGRKATKLCTDRGIMIDSIPDPRFGTVNMYPRNILVEVFNSVNFK